MKIFLSLLTFICICFGDVFEDGIKAFESGNYTKAVGTQRIWPARAFTLGHLTHNDLASVRI